MEEVAKELDEEEQASNLWRTSFSFDGICNIQNPSSNGGLKVLSQYECDQCGEEHYHTKRNVSTCNIKQFWSLIFKAAVIDHPGYQFADPCPPSMKEVNQTFLLLFSAINMKSVNLQLRILILLGALYLCH